MKTVDNLTLSTSPSTQPAGKPRRFASLALRRRSIYERERRCNAGKELDNETGLYYYGARYLDPKTSRWLSGDPAMGEYIPSALVNEEAKKRNGSLPGMGGVFNYANLHVYHYAGNNPVKYVDPNGEDINELTDGQWDIVKKDIEAIVNNLNDIIQELTDFDAGKIDSLSPNLIAATSDYLGVDFSLPFDAKILGKHLTKIKDSIGSMSRNDFRYDDFNKKNSNIFAYAYPFGNKIYLGDKYFNSSNVGNDTRQGTLIHERTHKFTILFTNDKAYGTRDALNLRGDKKAGNADNWEYFYERLKTGGR